MFSNKLWFSRQQRSRPAGGAAAINKTSLLYEILNLDAVPPPAGHNRKYFASLTASKTEILFLCFTQIMELSYSLQY